VEAEKNPIKLLPLAKKLSKGEMLREERRESTLLLTFEMERVCSLTTELI
jgi:hypothetical protein